MSRLTFTKDITSDPQKLLEQLNLMLAQHDDVTRPVASLQQTVLSISNTLSGATNVSVQNNAGSLVGTQSKLQFLDSTTPALTWSLVNDTVGSRIQLQPLLLTSPVLATAVVGTTRTLTVAGTSNRITSSAGAQNLSADRTWTLDIAATYVGQTSITTLGTITTGTWNATPIGILYGGSGQTTANAALNAFLPTQTGNNGKFLQTDGSNTSWQSAGSSSPLTTKGDIYVYSTVNDRLPVGTDGFILSANSTEATGLKWIASTGSPGGLDSYVQYNNGGAFGGEITFRWDDSLKILQLGDDESVAGAIGFAQPANPGITYLFAATVGDDGDWSIEVPAASGTMAVSGTSPIAVSNAGDITITSAALSKADDTNVTLTLTGSPSTALLAATTITAGWTGTLSVARGGTGTGTAFTQGSVIFADGAGVYAEDNANFFWDDTNNRLSLGSTVTGSLPTLTLASGKSFAIYNTTVDATNFEYLRMLYSSNVATLQANFGGTGTARTFSIEQYSSASSVNIQILMNRAGTPFLRVSPSNFGGASTVFNVTGNSTASSGAVVFSSVTPTVTETGTAGYTGFLVNPTESSLGSGASILMDLQVGSTSRFRVDNAGLITATQKVITTGSPTLLTITGGAHTTLTASTEAIDVNFNLARVVQFATGAITTQRAVVFQAPTYGFVGASTITTATTVAITGAPIAGTNATITNPLALHVAAGLAKFSGDLQVTGATTLDQTNVITLSGISHKTLYVDSGGILLGLAHAADGSVFSSKGTTTAPAYRTLNSTTNQVTVTTNAGNFTFSTPQDIHTSATPQFLRMGLGTAADGTIKLFIGEARTVAAPDSTPQFYIQNTTNSNQGHAALTLDKGAATAAATINLRSAATTKWDFGLLDNNHFTIRDLAAVVKCMTLEAGTPANTIYTAAAGVSFGSATVTSLVNIGSSAQTQFTTTGLLTKYLATTTAANGLPPIVASSNLTAQGAAIAATTIYAVPASGSGQYRISWVATITRAATTSCTLGGAGGFGLVFTDANDSVVKTSNPAAVTFMTSSVNATGTTVSGVMCAICKPSTNLQYSFGYTSSGATSMQYDLVIKVEWLG